MSASGYFNLAKRARRTAESVADWVPEDRGVKRGKWKEGHVSLDGKAVPYHFGQVLAYNSPRRLILMIAGTQGGKTSFGPWWLWKEIRINGGGDYLAVAPSYDLFKLKMLPAILETFVEILGIGRYWGGDKVLEIAHPSEGFLAKRSTDPMWGRIILRSAESASGLESATAKAAWLDEAGQEKFKIGAWRAIKRRLALSRGRILITTTLYELGWLDRELMEPAEKEGTRKIYRAGAGELIRIDSEKVDTTLIQFDSIVNPKYPMEEFEEAKETLPEDEFEMQYRGRVSKGRVLIYDCFDVSRDVVERFAIPGNWNKWVGVDFGGTNTAGVYYAEEPETGVLFAYRLYKEGKLSAEEHGLRMIDGEEGELMAFGGAHGEGQWRKEFSSSALYIHEPPNIGLELGILRVYAAKKRGKIKYFDDLWPIVDENLRYKRKVDEFGNITDDIVAKKTFHFLDAERYIVSYVKATASSLAPGSQRYA